MRETDIVVKREDMATSILKLKEMKLLERDYQIKVIKYTIFNYSKVYINIYIFIFVSDFI